jgi:hypothetical protein
VTLAGFDRALGELGVGSDTLTARECRSLLRHGYLIFEGVLGEGEVRAMSHRVELVLPAGPGTDWFEAGVRRVALEADPPLDRVCFDTRALAAARQLLGTPFFARDGLALREPLRGFGQQRLHLDRGAVLAPNGRAYSLVVHWLLDAYTEDNGALRVVAGSHLLDPRAVQAWSDPHRRHPGESLVVAPAGSLLVFDSRLWHSGTTNRSGARRRTITTGFDNWDDSTGIDLVATHQIQESYARAQDCLIYQPARL